MNILIVYTHQDASSFTAAMKNAAIEELERQGHSVVVSDLYAQGFSAVAQKWDFVTSSGGHFNYMLEQKHAAKLNMSFSPDIVAEIQKLLTADIIIFIFPVWWSSVPALLKGWFDRVLAMGVAWDGGQLYAKGLMRGKQAMLIAAAGGPTEFFHRDGAHQANPFDMLHPINHGTLAFCGFDVHEPYVALNVLGCSQEELAKKLQDMKFRLSHLVDSPNFLTKY